MKFDKELAEWPFYVIPIESGFLFGEERRFTGIISKFITGFNQSFRDTSPDGKQTG